MTPADQTSELPAEVQDAMRAEQEERAEKLVAFSRIIAGKRDEAVAARLASGIETTWMECEEAYVGIDDANRHEYAGARWTKATTMDAPIQRRTTVGSESVRSTGFVRLTSRYVDAAAAKASEITIPVDGKAFSLKATPIPDAVKLQEDLSQFVHQGQPQFRKPKPGEVPQQPGHPAPEAVPLTVKDLADHALEMANKSAKKAETRVHDWLVECGHARELRKVIFDGARIGVGVIKGPVPDRVSSNAITKTPEGIALEIVQKTVPVTRWVDPWNLYPDPACGENIHDGDFILEKDEIAKGKLKNLKRSGMYLNDAIDQVIAEGPGKCLIDGRSTNQTAKTRFTIWYWYGRIDKTDMDLVNPGDAKTIQSDSVFAIVTLVNDTVIRAVINPLDSGSFPYHTFSWRRRAGHWAGVGVGEQIRFPQRLINAATRAMTNNAAKSAGSIIVIDDTMLVPADGNWTLTPDKVFRKAPETAMDDVRKAFATFQIPNTTEQLLAVIEYALKLAEESTNIPLVTQGQSGKTTPDTFGGQQLQDNNANQLLRDVGYSIADGITNPLVRQMYEWLLLDPDVPDDEKGDHQVDANAAVAMIEKALQDRAVMMIAPMAADPGFGFDKAKVGKAIVRINRLSPDDLMLSEEDIQRAKENPPPPPPAVAAAQIRAESAEKIAASHDQLAAVKIKTDTDRDAEYNRVLAAREQNTRESNLEELRLKRDLAMLEYAKEERLNLQDAKVKLATTTMELQTQTRLAGMDGKGPEVATPPTEPPGRAADGTAYQA